VFGVKNHLDDDALIKRYLAERGLEVLDASDEPELKHLAHCDACLARYADTVLLLDAGREAAVAQADAAFTPDHLAHQRDRIMRRLEAQAGPKVLAFPAAARTASSTGAPVPMLRWVAAAAIAGLMVGVTAGHYLDFGSLFAQFGRPASTVAASGRATPHAVPSMRPAAGNVKPADDDDLLLKVDGALSTDERTSELAAIYALTLRGNDAPRMVRTKY